MTLATAPEGDRAAHAARVGWLDGARGVAILAVMVTHLHMLAFGQEPMRLDVLLRTITGAGWAGVDLFFVLSGFLITGILLDAKQAESHYFRNFYARRSLRIFPLYYGFLALLLVALPALHSMSSREYQTLQQSQAWYWTYLSNYWIALRDGWNVSLYGTVHLWSLAVEEQFYLIWPAIVLVCNRRALVWVCVGAIAGAPALRLAMHMHHANPFVVYTFTAARLDPLAVGAIMAVLIRGPRGRAMLSAGALPAMLVSGAVLVLVVVLAGGLPNLNAGVQLFGLSALAVFFAGLLAHGLTTPSASVVQRLFSPVMLKMLGRYSYGLYIVHWPIATWLAWHIRIHAILPKFPGSPLLSELLFAALAFTLSMTAAWLSWHLYEKQFLKLKRYFPYARVRAVTRAEAAADRPAPAPGEFAPSGTEPRAA